MARHPLAALLLAAGLALAGCVTSAKPSPAPSPEATVQAPALLMVRGQGGLCPYGLCRSATTIRRDGSFTSQYGPETPREGTIGREWVDALAREIEAADFAAIASVPFTELCPSAYDGQESIYTFYAAAGPQELSDCKVKIDPEHPLFKAAHAAHAEIIAVSR